MSSWSPPAWAGHLSSFGSRCILATWSITAVLGVLAVTVVFARPSIELGTVDQDLPSTPARKEMSKYFSDLERSSDLLASIHCLSCSDVTKDAGAKTLAQTFKSFAQKRGHGSLAPPQSWYDVSAIPKLQQMYKAQDPTILVVTSYGSPYVWETVIKDFKNEHEQELENYELHATCYDLLWDEIGNSMAAQMLHVDILAGPVAAVVLYYTLKSGKLLALVFANLFFGISLGWLLLDLVCVTTGLKLDEITTASLMHMLSMSLGLDYSLFTLVNYCSGLKAGLSAHDAVFHRLELTYETIFASSGAMVGMLAGLATVPDDVLKAAAVAAICGIAGVLLSTATLVPAALLTFGSYFGTCIPPDPDHKVGAVRKTKWFDIGMRFTQSPDREVALLLSAFVAIPLVTEFFGLHVAYSPFLVVQRSNHYNHAFQGLLDNVSPQGLLSPTYILTAANPSSGQNQKIADAVDSSQAIASALVTQGLMPSEGILSIGYDRGTVVSAADALQHAMRSADAQRYSGLLTQSNGGASLMVLYPSFFPVAGQASKWNSEVRKIIAAQEKKRPGSHVYLWGHLIERKDETDRQWKQFLVRIGETSLVVVCLVGVCFRSALLPLRLLLTVVVPVLAIGGLAALVFQVGVFDIFGPGPLHSTDSLFVTGALMILATSVGLALDYDIFLLSRMRAYRCEGYTQRDAIVKALNDTGPTISAAATMMAVVFGSNIFGDVPFFNQMAFLMSSGVLTDAFFTRPILVPAICSYWAETMWWPSPMPEPTKCLADEIQDEDSNSTSEAAGLLSGDEGAPGKDGGVLVIPPSDDERSEHVI